MPRIMISDLNSGKLGFDKCVDAIEAQLKIMLGK